MDNEVLLRLSLDDFSQVQTRALYLPHRSKDEATDYKTLSPL